MGLQIFNLTFSLPLFLLVLFRVSSFFMVIPVFGGMFIPSRIRVAISVLVSLIVLPLLPKMPAMQLFSLQLVLLAVEQVVAGMVAGFVVNIMFEVFLYAGQLISLQTGLGFATLMDPQAGSINMISRIYSFAIILVFLMLNGHLMVIQDIVHSFTVMPLLSAGITVPKLKTFIAFAGSIFSGALSISLPAIIALLMVNLTFAIMTRSAPTLNIFTIGFPITLMIGLLIIYLTFPTIMGHAQSIFNSGFSVMHQLLQAN